jgi:uncharacterized SAM-binding protein YcdF (DUF218 family)
VFFVLSKLFWLVASPANLLLLLAVAGAILLFTRFWVWGRRLCVAALVGLAVLGVSPLGWLLLSPLENRFARPAGLATPPAVIVVLGGAIQPEMSRARRQVSVNEAAGRLTEALALARRFPAAKVVYSGCSAALGGGPCEADVAGRFFTSMGVARERVLLERASRNTQENALFTRDAVAQKEGEVWLLVTSAFHMPRAMGAFRKVGVSVTPWPAAYLTAPNDLQFGHVTSGLRLSETALREWIGLIAYRLTGRIDYVFPAP